MDEFSEVKRQLEDRKQELQHRYDSVNDDLQRKKEPLEKDFAEQSVQRENDQVLGEIAHSAKEEIKQINVALQRIEGGEYNICSSCGEDIPAARLEAIPYTSLCINCASRNES